MSDRVMAQVGMCACQRVKYDPILLDGTEGGRMRERWRCEDCKMVFVKQPVAPALPDVAQNYEQNLRYATQIAEYLHKSCYSEVTQWKPISGDLFGVLMQIDNMCTCEQSVSIRRSRESSRRSYARNA